MISTSLGEGPTHKIGPSPQDSLLVVFWNVENFFDYHSESKPQYWTAGRFYAKCDAVAKTLLRIADRYGRLPDAVGFAEVENGYVLRQLLSATVLRKLDYRIVHYESPDHRGIDCALLCREGTLPLRASAPKHLPDSAGGVLPTRDILLAEFDSLAILVNHHPSQIGGKEDRRRVALDRLRGLQDSLRAAGTRRTLAVGDFNQDLWGEILRQAQDDRKDAQDDRKDAQDDRTGGQKVEILRQAQDDRKEAQDDKTDVAPTSVIPGLTRDLLRGSQRGTIKYNGQWEKIDGGFAEGFSRVREEVFADPVLLEPDAAFGGEKPRRTFVGPRYRGGVSDHLPVVFVVYY